MGLRMPGVIKWFRKDGVGYITDMETGYPLYFDTSSLNCPDIAKKLQRGVPVWFQRRCILGRQVAINVDMILSEVSDV
jgi:cold shock CspA family protein